jgi:hypothetical protein
MKTILISFTVLGALAGAASADKAKSKAKKPNFGESFELKSRSSSRPHDIDPAIVRNVAAQPARAIKDKVSDLEICWLKLSAGKRLASSAMLRLTVEAAGNVSAVRVDGELPAGVAKCISSMASRWSWAPGDARSEIEHGVTLTTK